MCKIGGLWELSSVLCDDLEGWNWGAEGRRDGKEGGDYVYI